MVWRVLRLMSFAAVSAAMVGAQSTAPAAAPVAPTASADAAFDFVVGKLSFLEGSARDAVAAYEKALTADPGDPYLHFEYGSLLLRQAQFSPANRESQLKRAIEQASAAAKGAPEDVDVLRLLGEAQLGMAETDDAALPEARHAFEAVIARRPEDLPSLAALGQIYLALGEAAKAADVLTVASRLRPDNPSLTGMLLDALLKAERKAEASALLRRSLTEDPSDLQSRLALADLESDADDHRAAAELLRAAPGEQRASSDVRRRLALEEYRNGAIESAPVEIDSLLAAEPGYTGGHYLRGILLSALARNAEAEKEFADLLQKNPEAVDFALNLARVIERQGRRSEANAFLEETLRHLDADPKSAENAPGDAARLRIALALSAARAKDWPRVESSLRPMLAAGAKEELRDEAIFISADAMVESKRGDDALALLGSRDDAPYAAKRCEVLQRLERSQAARECFDRLADVPGGEGLVEAADARQRLDDFAASIPLLERARKQVSEPTEVDYRLASAYERTGQRLPALGLLRGILERRPDYAPALNYLGYMLAEKGENLEEAVGLAERAVELDPGNGAYVDSLGWAHFQLRQFDQARIYLERAAGLVPDDATICEHLGDVYAAVGDTQKARVVYRQALDLGGENAGAVEVKLRGLPGGS